MEDVRATLESTARKILGVEKRRQQTFTHRIMGLIAVGLIIPPLLLPILILLTFMAKDLQKLLGELETAKAEQLRCLKECGLGLGPHVVGYFPTSRIFRLNFGTTRHDLEYPPDDDTPELLSQAMRLAEEKELLRVSSVSFLQSFSGKAETAIDRGMHILSFNVSYELEPITDHTALLDRFPSNELLVRALQNSCRLAAQWIIRHGGSVRSGDCLLLPSLPYHATVTSWPEYLVSQTWAAQSRKR